MAHPAGDGCQRVCAVDHGSAPDLEHRWTFGFAGALLLLVSLIAVTPGELGRIPFDIAEAETELAGGCS